MPERIGRSGETHGEGMNRGLPCGVYNLWKCPEVICDENLPHVGICYSCKTPKEGREEEEEQFGEDYSVTLRWYLVEFSDTIHLQAQLWMTQVVEYLHFILVS